MPPAPRGILRLRMCHGPAASLRKSPPRGSGGGLTHPTIPPPDTPFPARPPPQPWQAAPAEPPAGPRRHRPRSEGREHSLAAAAGRNRAAGGPRQPPPRPGCEDRAGEPLRSALPW